MRLISQNKAYDVPYESSVIAIEEGLEDGEWGISAQTGNVEHVLAIYDAEGLRNAISQMQMAYADGKNYYRFPQRRKNGTGN